MYVCMFVCMHACMYVCINFDYKCGPKDPFRIFTLTFTLKDCAIITLKGEGWRGSGGRALGNGWNG